MSEPAARVATRRRASSLPHAVVSLLLAVGLVVAVFPEVVFLEGSLAPIGLNDTVDRNFNPETVRVYPDLLVEADRLGGRTVRQWGPREGSHDIGAITWQLVPATKFMNRAIFAGESPFWNPYSAAGSLGTETLADVKLSPFVLSVAVFGASSAAFTFVLLAFVAFALFCLQQFFTRTLRSGRLAGTAACIVFLLNGFAIADLASHVGAPYVLFPIVLYAQSEWLRTGKWWRFLVAVTAYAALVCTTFVSVALLMLLVVTGITLAIDAPRWNIIGSGWPSRWRIAAITGRQVTVPAVALLLTAFVWLPAVAAVRKGGSDFESYSERTPRVLGLEEIVTILTPRRLHLEGTTSIAYIGVAALMVIAAAWPRSRGNLRLVLTVSSGMALFAITQYAGIPVFRLIGELPGVRAIRNDYWSSMTAASVVVAVGVAVAVIAQRGMSVRAALVAGGVFGLGLSVLLVDTAPSSGSAILAFVGAFVVIVAVVVLALMGARRALSVKAVATLAVVLIIVEMLPLHPPTRLARADLEDDVPEYVTFLQEELDGDRVLNAGRAGLYAEWGTVLKIPQVETLNIGQVPEYREFFYRRVNPGSHPMFLEIGNDISNDFTTDPSVLDLLSVQYIVVDETMTEFDAGVRVDYPLVFNDKKAGVRIYENPDAFPRAYLSRVVVDANEDTEGEFSTATTLTDDAELLADAEAAGIASSAAAGDSERAGTARITSYTNDEVRVEVDATEQAVLVLTDAFHSNWDVSVNRDSEHLALVNEVMRGVMVPKGRSTVVFSYESTPRTIGSAASAATLVGLLAVSVVQGVRVLRRRQPTPARRRAASATGSPRT
jgi:hypothetical protein